jgi:hypothetical protein
MSVGIPPCASCQLIHKQRHFKDVILHLLARIIAWSPTPAEIKLIYCRIKVSKQATFIGWSCAVIHTNIFNLYINTMTIGVEQNGFLGRLPGCIHLPWPIVDKDLLINEHKDLDWHVNRL